MAIAPIPTISTKQTHAKTTPMANSKPNSMDNIVRHLQFGPQDGRKSEHYMKKICLILLLIAAFPIGVKAQCSPFQGLGAAQFFNNSGVPLTNGVLYSFQAGTTTQQATFTDSTCSVPNVNPVTFLTGARVNIWLTTGNFYKFQLCLQNDGATCAPGDVLFSVDNVPGGATGGGGGGGPPFVSGSPNPATSGILRCASGDQCVVFRNQANSANLAITKDSSDVLSWAGGSIKFPAVPTPSGLGTGFSWLWDDSTANRWKVSNNGAAGVNLVVSGVDINTSDQVTQLHFGATGTPLSGTAPTTNQLLQWNGSNIVGSWVVYTTASASTTAAISATTMATAGASGNLYRFSWYLTQTTLGSGCTSATGIQPEIIYTDPSASSSTTLPFLSNPITNNGTVGPVISTANGGSIVVPATTYMFRAKAGTTVQYAVLYVAGTNCAPSPAYQIYPLLEQITFN